MLRVTLLGTGATMPTPERGLAAMALSCQGRTILFDCGEGTQLQMRRHHVSAARVDFIALTHYHGDHIFGLPGLLQTIACLGRTEPLYFAGPEGLERAMAPIFALAGPMPFEIRGVTLGKNGADLSEFLPGWPRGSVLSAVETAHRVMSQGYVFHLRRAGRFLPEQAELLGVQKKDWGKLQRGERVGRVKPSQVMGPERPGLTVAFSGDTKPCRAFEKAAKGADLLIHEATYASEADRAEANRWGHSTFADAAEAAVRTGAKRLWLTHLSQAIEDEAAALETARAIFPAAECPPDGHTIRLSFPESNPNGGNA